MLIKFSSEQSADFVMLHSAADHLLSMMGHGGSTEGSVSGEALVNALDRLNSAIAREQDSPTNADLDDKEEGEDTDEGEGSDEPKQVALPARAAPLIAMLRRAKDADGYVMWRQD